MDFSFFYFVLILLLTFLCLIIGISYFKKTYLKISLLLFCVGYFLWSGIGICYGSVDKSYIFYYFVFLIFFIFGFYFSQRRTRNKKCDKKYKFPIPEIVVNLCCIVFVICFLARLFYPKNVITNLLHPQIYLLDYFTKEAENSLLSYILKTLVLVTRPFFYIKLFLLKKPIVTILTIAFGVLTQIALNNYVARTELIFKAMLIVFVLVSQKNELLRKQKNDDFVFKKYLKSMAAILLAVFISLPFLVYFTYLRRGVSVDLLSFNFESASELFEIEFGFPKLYDKAMSFHSLKYFPQYLFYLITLPFPKSIFGISSPMILNYSFSEYVLGISVTDYSFYVVLPGMLGESFIIGGRYFYWAYALLVGLICGFFVRIFSKYKELRIWTIYVILQIFLMNRGGSQGFMGEVLNGSLLLLVLLVLFRVRTFRGVNNEKNFDNNKRVLQK